MNRKVIAQSLVLLAAVAAKFLAAVPQRLAMPGVGAVTLKKRMEIGEFPKLEFLGNDGRVLFSQTLGQDQPVLFRIRPRDAPDGGNEPVLTYFVVHPPTPDGLAVVPIVKFTGGSDCTYEATMIAPWRGRLRAWLPHPLAINAEGGYYVGDLGSGHGYGWARWNLIWGNEAHVAPHRYTVQLYRMDRASGALVQIASWTTRKFYDSSSAALAEFGLCYPNLLASRADLTC